MTTGCYIHRIAESNFKQKQSRKYGKTSLEWLAWLSHSQNIVLLYTNLTEKHRGSAIVICPVDGWCAERVFFHGCPCQEEHTNTVNGKSDLLSATKTNAEYLKHYGTVVEMWECEWKKMRTSPDIKHVLDSKCPNREMGNDTAKRFAFLNCLLALLIRKRSSTFKPGSIVLALSFPYNRCHTSSWLTTFTSTDDIPVLR